MHGLCSVDELSRTKESRRSVRSGRRFRILFTMYGWNDDGGGTILPRQLAQELSRQGHEVAVIYTAAHERPDLPAYAMVREEEEGVRLYAVYNRPTIFYDLENPEREIKDSRMTELFNQVLSDFRPDIVHIHSLLNFSFAIIDAAYEQNVPVVYTSHNYWPLCPRMYLFDEHFNLCPGASPDGASCGMCIHRPDKQAAYAERVRCSRESFEKVDLHLAVSSRVREMFIANGHDPERIRVVQQSHREVDLIWETVGRHRSVVRKGRQDPLRLTFIGGVYPHKGVHVLAKAVQAFSPDQVRCDIWGMASDPYLKVLNEIDVQNNLTFHGRYELRDLPNILATADFVVVPSIWEDCAPLVVCESLAARVPVIGARIGGIPDFIRDGLDGLLFKAGDPLDLAEKISSLIDSPDLVLNLQSTVAPPRLFGAYVDEVTGIYEDVCARHIRRSSSSRPRLVAHPSNESRIRVKWEGSQFVYHSLALVNREMAVRLALCPAVELSLVPYERHQFGPEADPRFGLIAQHLGKDLSGPADVWVQHLWPPKLEPPPEGRWVVIQPWEFGAVPRAWVEAWKDCVDEIWVPSEFVRNCYVRSGLPADRIHVVPNGVDINRYTPRHRPIDLMRWAVRQGIRLTEKTVKFLFVGGTIYRKGIDTLLSAYCSAFSREDDVCLIIKDMGGKSFYKGQTAAAAILQLQQASSAPQILYIQDDLTEDEIAGLYTAADCLVHPFRGEGFGLPIAEAMAAGLPVIVSKYGPALELCDDDRAYFVPGTIRHFPEARVGELETVGLPWLFEPDPQALASILREVADVPEEARRRGVNGRSFAETHLTWDHAFAIALQRLVEISRQSILRTTSSTATLGNKEVLSGRQNGTKTFFVISPKWDDPSDQWLLAVKEFAREFRVNEDVQLVIATGGVRPLDKIANLLVNWAAYEGIDLDSSATIDLRPDTLSSFVAKMVSTTGRIVMVDTSSTALLRSSQAGHGNDRGLVVIPPNAAAMREAVRGGGLPTQAERKGASG